MFQNCTSQKWVQQPTSETLLAKCNMKPIELKRTMNILRLLLRPQDIPSFTAFQASLATFVWVRQAEFHTLDARILRGTYISACYDRMYDNKY
jgi:hypothetical protein